MSRDKPIVILGAGGHASVVVDVLKALKMSILGFVGPQVPTVSHADVDYLGTDEVLRSRFSPLDVLLVNAIGSISVEKNQLRQKIFSDFKAKGYRFASIVHPMAYVANNVTLKEGCQVMAGAVIQPNVIVEENVIINTNASVDHDCKIGHSVHIAPGAVLSGGVNVGENAFVGVGATIIQGVTIGDHAMVRAGKVVLKDVKE